MRLQLIACVLAITASSTARGDGPGLDLPPSARATFRFYADDDHMTVYSPGAATTVALTARTTLDVDASADIISGASVDVLTSASPGPISEQRVEAGLALTRAVNLGVGTQVSLLTRASHENDYDALRVGAVFRTELATRNFTLDVRYLAGRDVAGDVTDDTFRRTRFSHQVVLVLSQVLGTRTVASVVVDANHATGYHASPYRSVWITTPAWPLPERVDEVTPRVRNALAVAAHVRRAIGAAWFLTVDARGYRDDWDISSATLTTEVRRELGERLLVGGLVRGYVQSDAAFYRSAYVAAPTPPSLRTADRTLGAMGDVFVSATADVALDDDNAWHLVTAAGVHCWWFLDFPAQARRRALVVTSSLTIPF